MAGAIVVGYDGSAGSRAALDTAVELARQFGDRLVIVFGAGRPAAWARRPAPTGARSRSAASRSRARRSSERARAASTSSS